MGLFFTLLPLLYLVLSIYIYRKLLKAASKQTVVFKTLLTLFFCVASLSFIMTFFLSKSNFLPDTLLGIMYRFGSLWMIFIIYTALISIILGIARRVFPSFKCNLVHSAIIAVAILYYGHYNYLNPQIVPIDIELDKPMKGEMRIAVVSDLHLGHGIDKKTLKRFVDEINSQNPDLILIAGDLIDNDIRPVVSARFDEELSQLRAPMGIYMAPGNHEYISGYEECLEYLNEKTPIAMFRDTIITLPNDVQLLLRDSNANRKRARQIKKLHCLADTAKPIILVDHTPLMLSENDKLGIDIQLSGHTHHGQVWPGNYITDYKFEQSYGYRKWEHTHVWVSSGLSLWGPPVRLGTKGDIAIITLRGK